MAQVAPGTEQQPDIDDDLNYQFRAWESVPEHMMWWPELDPAQRETFHLEWVGITEARLRELCRLADAGRLTPMQLERYAALTELIGQRREMLARLLAT